MKLVILVTNPIRVDFLETDNPVVIEGRPGSTFPSEEYGRDWARWYKDDIVMLIED